MFGVRVLIRNITYRNRMKRVELLWRLVFGDRFFSVKPAPPITGLFLPIIMAIFFSSEGLRSTGDDERVQTHFHLPQYLGLITQLVGLEPDSQPFLPEVIGVQATYLYANSVSQDEEEYWDNFHTTCFVDAAHSLVIRAEEAGLASELDIFLSNHLISPPVTPENGLDLITSNLITDIENAVHSIQCHFVGAQTGCVCSSSHAIEEEDQIWLLHGLSSPVVLRPLEDGSFEFLGVVSLSFLDPDVNVMDEDYVNRETKRLWIK